MATYKIRNFFGKYLSIDGENSTSLSNNQNIVLENENNSDKQKWEITSLSSSVYIKSLIDVDYALNYYRGGDSSSNCDVYPWLGNYADAIVSLISDGNYYRIRLNNYDLYLTAESDCDCSNIFWEPLGSTTASRRYQKWKCEPIDRNCTTLNGWLKMYSAPTSEKVGRNIYIPTVETYVDTQGHTYQFSNSNYWWAYENQYAERGDMINPWACYQIEQATSKEPIINIGNYGEYTDECGNYWMAVGPNVVNPNHHPNDAITLEEMYGRGKLDIVVRDNNGKRYYIPAVVGDTKAHTWSNGVIQTNRRYPDGELTYMGMDFNGQVCAEFIGAFTSKSFSDFGEYAIEKIIFYED